MRWRHGMEYNDVIEYTVPVTRMYTYMYTYMYPRRERVACA